MNIVASGTLWTLLLCALVLCVFFLPLVPAFVELYRPKDVEPLKVLRDHDGHIANFARRFEQFIDTNFSVLLTSLDRHDIQYGQLNQNTPYILIGSDANFSPSEKEINNATFSQLLMSKSDLKLPNNLLFEAEIYAIAGLETGAFSGFRAVLCKSHASFGVNNVILRWVHAEHELSIDEGSQLFGRASSQKSITIQQACRFERMNAPQIIFGSRPTDKQKISEKLRSVSIWSPSNTEFFTNNWCRIRGDVTMPEACGFDIPLVVRGNLQVGAGSWIRKALKSSKNLVVNEDCRVDDSVVAEGRLVIAENCFIKGPIISEVEVIIRKGCIIGSETEPTTISAPRITIEPEVIVFGTVWARKVGTVSRHTLKER